MKKEQKHETQCYRLVEMADSVKDSIESAKKVRNQQQKLAEILRTSEHAEEFKEFVENVGKSNESLNAQITELEQRLEKLEVVNAAIEKSETFDKLVDALIFALGMFKA